MSGNLRLYNSSGYVELQAPDNAESQTLVLPTDSIQPALVHINTTDFSAASSVSLDNVFTSDYDNYRVMFTGSSSAGGTLLMRLRSSGSDATGSDYSRQLLESYGTTVLASSATATSVYVTWLSTILGFMALDMFSPHLSVLTAYSSMGGKPSNSIQVIGHHNVASSYDGLTIYPTSGTITGTIRVYGYRNS